MSPNGIVVTQSSSPFFSRRTFWSIEKTMSAVFPKTVSYHLSVPAFGIWGFNLATMTASAEPGPITASTRYLTDEVFRASQVFGKDAAPQPTPSRVNTIFEPILYQLYLKDQRTPVAPQKPAS
jgi:spermidine synthase